jgi:hypothetical protein
MLSLHLPLTTLFLAGAAPSLIGSAAIFLMGRAQGPSQNAQRPLEAAAS